MDVDDADAASESSFVKIKKVKELKNQRDTEEAGTNEPDIYDVDILAWGIPVSPLHLAIMHGHVEIIDLLVASGADITLPAWVEGPDTGKSMASLPLSLVMSLPSERSLAVTKSILNLGASPAQADTNYVTALHTIAAAGDPMLIDSLYDIEGAATSSAVNHPGLKLDYQAEFETPMTAAVLRGNSDTVNKLLRLGADPGVPYDSFERLLAKNSSDEDWSPDVKYTAPVTAAVQCHRADLARLLLENGADPNTLSSEAKQAIKDKMKRSPWQQAWTLLDFVNSHISVLDPEFPKLDEEDDVYLSELPNGTYRRWLGQSDLGIRTLAMTIPQENHRRQLKKNCGPKLTEEELVSRLKTLRDSFRELREVLISKGAKTIDELHPAIIERDLFSLDEENEIPFEAVWNGDADTVKALTLSPWGKGKERPLHVSTRDYRNFTPLALAVLRSDAPMVQLIMEITELQYSPPRGRHCYRIASSSDGSDSDIDYASDSGLHKENIAENTTFNARDIEKVTPSRIHPVTLLQTASPFWRYLADWASYAKAAVGDYSENIEPLDMEAAFREPLRRIEYTHDQPKENPQNALHYAIENGDPDLANLLINLGVKYLGVKPDAHGHSPTFAIEDSAFEDALRRGQIDVLSTMISRTGAGIPFKELINRSGTEIVQKKPKYYQGLSVYGKKRHDWANRDTVHFTGIELTDLPVLRAIFYGNLDTVRADYAEAFENAGGCERVITSWWNTNRDLAIYCAIISKISPGEDIGRLELVLENMPELLDCQAWDGCPPLHLAFRPRKLSTAKYLIDRGAKQSLRDDEGANILHEILCGDETPRIPRPTVSRPSAQRMTSDSTTSIPSVALTPLAAWLDEGDVTLSLDRLRMILEKLGGADLGITNGVGDYPLHTAIKVNSTKLARILLEHDPVTAPEEDSHDAAPSPSYDEAMNSESDTETETDSETERS
ncbi:hypothetical protein FQN54_008968 [Arachnomyces sp. PD_36]|nr:hypothetical protein FQN54_008968 [Arachnomyces sp. PD_36]